MSITYKDSPDCVYHLRRAEFALRYFPKTIIFDPLMNFPQGGVCIWPPLFDATLALPSVITRSSLQPLVLYVPIAYAGVAIFAAGFAGLAIRRRFGWLVGLFVALCPGHIQYSQFGHTDQHVAESCWGFLLFALLLWSTRHKSRLLMIATGSALACAVLNWQGAIFWAPLLALPLMFSNEPDLKKTLLVLGLPTALCAIATWYWLSGFPVPFTYISFGWFQPIFLAMSAAVVCATIAFRKRSIAALLFTIAFAIPGIFVGRDFFHLLESGVMHLTSSTGGIANDTGEWLSYPKEWLSQIVEYRPLLADQWSWAIGFVSLAFFLSPIPIAIYAIRAFRKQNTERNLLLFAVGIFLFGFTLMQRRNVYYAAVLGGISAIELATLSQLFWRKKYVPCFIFAAFVLTMVPGYTRELRSGYEAGAERLEAMSALKTHTPQQINAYDARFLDARSQIPELKNMESVMTFWSQGHLVTYFGERPVVANNFGYSYFDCLHFFFSEDEKEALSILEKHKSRYVLVLDILPVMNNYGSVLGHDDYIQIHGSGWSASPRYFRTMQSRLCDSDGAGSSHFKLIWQSKEGSQRFGRFVSRWKLFEVM